MERQGDGDGPVFRVRDASLADRVEKSICSISQSFMLNIPFALASWMVALVITN
jgi:hypothetical protein